MEVKRSSCPWWLTWAVGIALAAVFVGERPLHDKQALRLIFSGGGMAFVLVATLWRGWSWTTASGDRRRIERILLLGYAGCAVSLALYFGSGDVFSPKASKLWTSIRVLWPILLACSALPMLAAQWAVGSPLAAAGSDADHSGAEAHRVAELAVSALSMAMVASFLFVMMYIVSERDKKIDVSYFKTSSPGSATVNMVNSLDEPLEVLLFFPAVNDVKDEVRGYFEELADKTGKVSIRELDRLVDSKLAEEYRVSKEGIVTLVKGDQNRNITLDTDMARARGKLVDLDSEVQKAFMKVAREARTAYFTVGHGELNDPASQDKGVRDPFRKVKAVRDLMTMLNYRVKDLGLRQGLAQEVPEDATIVIVLGATQPFLDAELAALDRYLAGGGALFLSLEPGSEVVLGPLEQRLGIAFNPAQLADETKYVIANRSPSDHANIVTDQFSSHASVTGLSRSRAGSGILFMGAGSFDEAEFSADYGKDKPKRAWVVKSLSTSFRDDNGNFVLDGDTEKKASYNLIAAIEGPKRESAPGDAKDDAKDEKDEPRRMRAFVLSDVQVLSDGVLAQIKLNRDLVLDSLKWLGGEEKFSGEVVSEKDRPLEHTKDKDVVWFYSTIIGAPLLVLGLGLLSVRLRRRRRQS
jgi:hypothetical protein